MHIAARCQKRRPPWDRWSRAAIIFARLELPLCTLNGAGGYDAEMAKVSSNAWSDAAELIVLGIGVFAIWPMGLTAIIGAGLVGAGLFRPFGRTSLGMSVGAASLVIIYVIALGVLAFLGKLSAN